VTSAWVLVLAAMPCLLAACAVNRAEYVSNAIVDTRDGQVYPTLKLGSQIWLGRDLSFAAPGSHCYGGRDEACPPNGRLYPWIVAIGACPAGWHLPDENEWQNLERHIGMAETALIEEGLRGTHQGGQLRRGGASGFAAPLSGYRRPDGSYARRGERSAYWLSTAVDSTAAWHRDIRGNDDRIYRSAVPIGYALSVRCLHDARRQITRRLQTSKGGGVVRDSKIAGGNR
jgi:uncharacterized protein (TIGR02145 family)